MGHAWCGRACERRLGLCLSPHRCAVKLSVLEHFMGAFKEVYRKRHMHPSSTGGLPDEQIYFVGCKPRGRRGGAAVARWAALRAATAAPTAPTALPTTTTQQRLGTAASSSSSSPPRFSAGAWWNATRGGGLT